MTSLLFASLQINPLWVLNLNGSSLTNLTLAAAGLALISLIVSLVALRRSRGQQGTAIASTATAGEPRQDAAPADDLALIAVLTAAFAVMLAEGQTGARATADPAAGTSPAGFTIRSVRRV